MIANFEVDIKELKAKVYPTIQKNKQNKFAYLGIDMAYLP